MKYRFLNFFSNKYYTWCSWYVKDSVYSDQILSEWACVCYQGPLLTFQFYGSPIQSVWRTRKPWEAMSRSSSALSPPRWRPTSPWSHGRKTPCHSSQVGCGLPRAGRAPGSPAHSSFWITNRVSIYLPTVMKNLYASCWRRFRLNMISVFSFGLYGWTHSLQWIDWWIEICSLHYVYSHWVTFGFQVTKEIFWFYFCSWE